MTLYFLKIQCIFVQQSLMVKQRGYDFIDVLIRVLHCHFVESGKPYHKTQHVKLLYW